MSLHRQLGRLALVAGLAIATPGVSAANSAPGVPVPVVHGTALNGDAVLLPQDLAGKVGVLVAGFSQDARGQVTDWGRRLAGEYRSSPTVLYYELPMISGVPRLLRSWVTGKIRDSTPDRARARIVPVTEHEPEWKLAAGYDKADDAYVMVVDRKGAICWRSSGALSETQFNAVKHAVEQALLR